MTKHPLESVVGLSEAPVALFSFLLHFVWEMWQVPFYVGMASGEHLEAVKQCTRASIGDVVIALIALWIVAALYRSRRWIEQPSWSMVVWFLAVGLVVTVIVEYISTHVTGQWKYAPSMPRLPLIDTGLLPMLQWLTLPLLVLWLSRRYLGCGISREGSGGSA